jgi:hypothetical protein
MKMSKELKSIANFALLHDDPMRYLTMQSAVAFINGSKLLRTQIDALYCLIDLQVKLIFSSACKPYKSLAR